MEVTEVGICVRLPFEHTSTVILNFILIREKNRKEFWQRTRSTWNGLLVVEVGLVTLRGDEGKEQKVEEESSEDVE